MRTLSHSEWTDDNMHPQPSGGAKRGELHCVRARTDEYTTTFEQDGELTPPISGEIRFS